MQEQSLVIREEGDDGWRVQVIEDEWPAFLSTKHYPTLSDVVRDLQSLKNLLKNI